MTIKEIPDRLIGRRQSQFRIAYKGFLQTVEKEFESKERAVQWLQQIGRPDLIPQKTSWAHQVPGSGCWQRLASSQTLSRSAERG